MRAIVLSLFSIMVSRRVLMPNIAKGNRNHSTAATTKNIMNIKPNVPANKLSTSTLLFYFWIYYEYSSMDFPLSRCNLLRCYHCAVILASPTRQRPRKRGARLFFFWIARNKPGNDEVRCAVCICSMHLLRCHRCTVILPAPPVSVQESGEPDSFFSGLPGTSRAMTR